MDLIAGFGQYALSFLVVFTAIVFVHELGHYVVARMNGVRVEVFSIGFGRELHGWNDRRGTRWKLSLIPLGGYVKMFGDRNVASVGSQPLTPAERRVAFATKPIWRRATVVVAGPVANFLFGIALFAGLFVVSGEPFSPPDIGAVQPGSPAAAAGIEAGDRVVSIDGGRIERFEDIRLIVQMALHEQLEITVLRGGRELTLTALPRIVQLEDRLGNRYEVGRLGVESGGPVYVRHDPATALWRGAVTAWSQIGVAAKGIGQMIDGTRAAKEIGGPLRIAWMSGEIAQVSLVAAVNFMALLSIHLGLINLAPVPLLDGGHLLFYAAEAIRGKPLGERAQEYGIRIGLALVLLLFVFATWNDLLHLKVVQFIQDLIT
ncbi:MAG: RIP metalloprotease RseP [Alphaproteobacteria bacterium]